jgi:hypothetical protein
MARQAAWATISGALVDRVTLLFEEAANYQGQCLAQAQPVFRRVPTELLNDHWAFPHGRDVAVFTNSELVSFSACGVAN